MTFKQNIMKRVIYLALSVVATLLAAVGCQYDDTNIWNEMEQIKDRIETLEQAVIKTNEDIVALTPCVPPRAPSWRRTSPTV